MQTTHAIAIASLTVASALAVELDGNGCRVLSKLPAPGVHPRVFFTAQDYPLMKARLATPRFNAKLAGVREKLIRQCRSDWRKFADRDFSREGLVDKQLDALVEDEGLGALGEEEAGDPVKERQSWPAELAGVTDEDIVNWFRTNEGRTAWGFVSVIAILEDDRELQDIMRRVIVNYARVVLASKRRVEEGKLEGFWAKQLESRLAIWKHNRWDVGTGWTFGAAGYAMSYDVLYNTMSEQERDLVRRAISAATTGRKSYGNGFPPGFASSNHYGYHGDLLVMLAAIEGEPGFDQETWDGIAQVLRDYWEKSYTPFGYSREDGYGPNLGMRGGGRGYMVLARRGYNIFATEKYRRFLRYLAMDWDPYPGGHLNGGASGGPYGGLYPTSTLLARYMYPEDPAANFNWRHLIGDDYERGIAWQCYHDYVIYGSDWRGPESREDMMKQIGLPLSLLYPVRGKFIARSDWSKDAMYLTFDARPDAHLIGHDKVDRGNFSMSALGRVWAFSGDFHMWLKSTQNSLVHVDGKAQPWKAPSVRFLRHSDDGTVAGGTADLKYAYDWEWTPPWPSWGKTFAAPWEPETNSAVDLGWPREYVDPDLCPDSIHGSHTGYGGTRNNLHRRPYNPVQKALRSAFLVRGKHPYVLICDDIRKDDAEHNYEWYMQLPVDLEVKSHARNRVVLREEAGGREMLLQFLQDGGCSSKVEKYVVSKLKDGTEVKGQRLIASHTCTEPGFRVLLYPYREGAPLPHVTGEGGNHTIAIGDQVDEIAAPLGNAGQVKVTRK